VFDIKKPKGPCSLCANLRRGKLNSAAKKYGCNKVALGHHSDDLIQTFFLSMFYEGRLNVFSPKTYMSRVDVTVIRPLILVEEKDIIRVSKDMPIINNCCPANHNTERERVKKLLNALDKEIPKVKQEIFGAITHPERYNLFDKFKFDD
jgi:tRNA(Ile)-lysidine synthase TilS/MesJ